MIIITNKKRCSSQTPPFAPVHGQLAAGFGRNRRGRRLRLWLRRWLLLLRFPRAPTRTFFRTSLPKIKQSQGGPGTPTPV